MATRDSLEASISKFRSLFTTAERKILDSSTGKALTAASERQVKDLLQQCRILRDKWRDLVGAQARSVKRGSSRVAASKVTAATPTNERSRQKHMVFTDVVTHIETHLAGITGQSRGKAAPATKPAAKQAAAKKTSTASAASASRSSAAKTSSDNRTDGNARTAATGSTGRVVSRKARQAGAIKALESSALSGLRTTKSQQRKASAALKAERLKIKGLTTRRAGHTKAQGGRSQARRDGRNAMR
jgi:DNA-binding protein HU-beta